MFLAQELFTEIMGRTETSPKHLVVKHADIKTGNVENRQNGFCICMFYHQRSGRSGNAQTHLS